MDEQETQQQEVVEQETPGSSEEKVDAPAPEIKVGKEEEVLPLRDRIAKRIEQVQKKPAPSPTAPKPGETPPAEKAAAVKTDPKPGETPPAGEKTPAEAFKADLKFKFTDEKGQKQEAEFPEFLRDSVKTKEQEEELRTLCAKAKGLDFIKPRFEGLRTRYQEINNAHGIVMGGIDELRSHVGRGDFDSFFARLQIPQEKVMQWVLEKVNYSELPPEQKAAFDARKTAEQRAFQAEQRLADMEAGSLEQVANAKSLALDAVITRPDIAAVATAYDQRTNKAGSFRELVRAHGELTWFRSQGQVDLTPDQAAQAVIAQFGLTPQATQAPAAPAASPAAPAAQGAPAASGTPTPPVSKAPPVIPNVSGRASSPSSGFQRPKNIAELKRMGKELAQAQ